MTSSDSSSPPPTADVDRVPLAEVRDLLQIGGLLPFAVLDRYERLLLNAGQRLSDEAQFEALVERGAWADRQLVEAERAAQAAAGGGKPGSAAPPPSLFERWERLLWQYDKLSRGLARKTLRGELLPPFLALLHALVARDPDVALFTCLRQDDRRFALYALTHAIHCAVVCELVGRQLGWPADRLQSLGCAALSMNLSIMELQAVMAEQDTPPTTRQRDRIRAHPEASAELLREAGVVDPVWLQTVRQHHEHIDGKGYPQGLTQPSDAAQLLRVADVYMAKISPRALRPAVTPVTAMRQLFQADPGSPLAVAMIKTLGIHPPGSLVKLQSGEVAVVIRRPVSGTHPLVATLSDKQGKPSLDTHRRDTAQGEFAISGPLTDATAFPRVLPERVYGLIAG